MGTSLSFPTVTDERIQRCCCSIFTTTAITITVMTRIFLKLILCNGILEHLVRFSLLFDICSLTILHFLGYLVLRVQNWKSGLVPLRLSRKNIENRLLNRLIQSTDKEDSIKNIGRDEGPATAGPTLVCC